MTADAGPAYEFDVALSFAGEDREYVEQVAEPLNAAGLQVFHDSDYQAEMWGEDLVEYLDQVYRLKAHYTIMFVSRHYAEKMWTRHERRSALARALEEKGAYVLPVRLDDTPLEGLRPTVGYLDARVVGLDGIERAALTKITGSAPAPPSAVTRVPRTEAERQQVLLDRQPGWEYLYFAAQLLHERDGVEGKYRDHEIEYAGLTGEAVERDAIFTYITLRINDAKSRVNMMSALVNNETAREQAFGLPGEAGDPERLAHLAKRWNSTYEELMDWAARVRGVSAPSEYQHLLELLARFTNEPLKQYRDMVDEYVAKVDALPAALAAEETVVIAIKFTITLPDDVLQEYNAEFDRLTSQLER
jgi:hypothetical protein